jgi:hypothetical protein
MGNKNGCQGHTSVTSIHSKALCVKNDSFTLAESPIYTAIDTEMRHMRQQP